MDDLSTFGPSVSISDGSVALSPPPVASSDAYIGNDTVIYDYLSDWQYNLVFSVGIISSTLSILGSTSIIHLILRDNQVNLNEYYHRLLLGLSIMDLFVTVSLFVSPFTLPAFTNLRFAAGTTVSCEVTAFFPQLIMGSYIYNASLSVYFLLTVKHGMKENEIAKWFEPYVHIVPVVVPIVTASIGLATDVFNPSVLLFMCMAEPFPGNCLSNPEVECSRGTIPDYAITAVMVAVMSLCAAIGIVSTWRIYVTIRRRAHATRQFSYDGEMSDQQRQRMRQVGTQAIWYTFAFLIGVLVVVIETAVYRTYVYSLPDHSDLVGNAAIFALVFFVWLLYPLQGFYNQLIYVRPRFLQWRKAFPDQSWFWAYCQV